MSGAETGRAGNLRAQALREVETLHAFFEAWFTGELAKSGETFARLEEALAEEFRYVLPEGRIAERAPVIEAIYGAHGGHGEARIEIRNLECRAQADGLALVFFEEHQWLDGARDSRFNTALLRANAQAPEGVEWVHLHETPQGAGA